MHKSSVPDYFLVGVSFSLILLGLIVLASVSAAFSIEKFDDSYFLFRHQILFGLLPGLILGFIAYKIDLSLLKKWAPFLLLINLIFLIMVFLPLVGSELEGASRWVNLGPLSFQPSEFLKLTFILYLATWLSSRTEKITSIKNAREFSQTFVAFLASIGLVSFLLILQPDISTLGVIVFVATIMYFSINTPFVHTIFILLIGGISLFGLIKLAPYRANRLLVFLNPDVDPMGIGYQVKQALIAIGSGGVGGVGLSMSLQKWGFLPQSVSDAVFAVFSEETGFVGGFVLILFFLLFLWRGFKIAKESQNRFSQLTAIGITSWIIVQSFVNIGAMVGLLPLTGTPLPFISYGGSALIVELMGLGLLLNISKKGQ